MRSRESCRIGYLAALLGSAFLLAGGCAGNGNGGSSIGSGGNPAETGGVAAQSATEVEVFEDDAAGLEFAGKASEKARRVAATPKWKKREGAAEAFSHETIED